MQASARTSATPLSSNTHLLNWVDKMAALTKPASIHWVDGSQEEYDDLCDQLVGAGTFIKLNQDLWPGCYYSRSDAGDVARVRAGIIAARPEILVELDEGAALDQLVAQVVVFFLRTIHPIDGIGLGESSHFVHPRNQMGILAQWLSRGSNTSLHN